MREREMHQRSSLEPGMLQFIVSVLTLKLQEHPTVDNCQCFLNELFRYYTLCGCYVFMNIYMYVAMVNVTVIVHIVQLFYSYLMSSSQSHFMLFLLPLILWPCN